ncbi:11801_t:CDS:2 [Entrophospora sp. SA101]|nr:16300_t:CDS:2 [Entrophospora sp. SA101]CAJ0768263.1 11794_t:CDS:2 [Entrophospora sp. SA101]CAJ0768268.1 11799_t:CDS:2 [Entrophospora sp. SA101]CAJ0768270.1 11801_t:CDS:2 [Entrophospora sp. SA101]CAJ0854353.1 13252_t:CDS:2 [Entrophospora sp. SA101]
MSGLNIIWIGLGVSGGVFVSYVIVPKGQNQTTCLILSLICCYLMWAITYLAQLHPLIVPKRSLHHEE